MKIILVLDGNVGSAP